MSEARIAELEQRVRDLEDRLHTLVLSVAYREDEPYFAEISRSMLSSDDRVVLGLVLSGILSRAKGSGVATAPKPESLAHPALEEAFRTGPVTQQDAIRIVGMVVGDEDSARRIIEAHRLQGLGAEGHRHLSSATG